MTKIYKRKSNKIKVLFLTATFITIMLTQTDEENIVNKFINSTIGLSLAIPSVIVIDKMNQQKNYYNKRKSKINSKSIFKEDKYNEKKYY